MKKKFIFHYDKINPVSCSKAHQILLAHDGMKCTGEWDEDGLSCGTDVVFDDGVKWHVFNLDLEEINE